MDNQNKQDSFLPVESFSQSFAKPFDAIADFTEATIDLFIQSDIAKNIPIIKSILAVKDLGVTIYQRHQIKKLMIFLQKLNTHINDPSVKKMREKILKDSSYLKQEAELALIIIEKTIEDKKSELLAEALYAYVKGSITQDEYTEILLIINQIFLNDLNVLQKVKSGNPNEIVNKDLPALKRLEGTGVIHNNVIDEMGLRYNHYELTNAGKKMLLILK